MRWIFGASLLALASPAAAEVKSASAGAFEVENKAVVAASPLATWDMLGRVSTWWSKDHSWSGDASNLSMDLNAGGCFCEKLPGGDAHPSGTVEHGRVIFAMAGQRLLLRAALGPMQSMPVTGVLTFALKPVEGGTEVTLTYAVAGHIPGGGEALAPAVDQVLAQQLEGLKQRLGG